MFQQNEPIEFAYIDDLDFKEQPHCMDETLEERIRKHAPGSAGGYYLEFHPKGSPVLRYPKVGAFSLKPFCPPTGMPFGTYNLLFVRYASDKTPLPPINAAEPYPRIQLLAAKKSPLDQAISDFQKAADASDGAQPEDRGEAEPDRAEPADRRAELDFAIASTPAMITARADYEKQRMAMELAENNQDILNKGQFSREAAEALALSRAYRREAHVAIEAHASLTRRTAEEVQSHWAAFRVAQEAQFEGMRMLKEQLESFAKPPPPPPPTDYTPAIVEGLRTLRDLGVAMVQIKGGVPLAPPPAPAVPLPNQTTTAKVMADAPPQVAEAASKADAPAVAPVSATSAPEVRGVIDPSKPLDPKAEAARLWRSLAETSEVEVLLATLGPEQLQSFLSRMRERVKP